MERFEAMRPQERIEQIIAIALLAVLAVGCLLILRPFVSALLWALILSFSSWPLRAWLVRRLNGRRTIAATLMTLLVAAIFILPLVVVGTGLAESVTLVAAMVGTLLEHGPPGPPAWLAELPLVGPDLFERWLELERLGAGWTAELQPHLETGRDWLLGIGLRLGEAILQVSLGVLAAFFFFRDGAEGGQRLVAAFERLAGNRAQRAARGRGRDNQERGLRCDRHRARPGHAAGPGALARRRARGPVPGVLDLFPLLRADRAAAGLAIRCRLAALRRVGRLGGVPGGVGLS